MTCSINLLTTIKNWYTQQLVYTISVYMKIRITAVVLLKHVMFKVLSVFIFKMSPSFCVENHCRHCLIWPTCSRAAHTEFHSSRSRILKCEEVRSRFSYRFSQSGLMTRVQRARPAHFLNPHSLFSLFLFPSRCNTLISFMYNMYFSLSLFYILSFSFSYSFLFHCIFEEW